MKNTALVLLAFLCINVNVFSSHAPSASASAPLPNLSISCTRLLYDTFSDGNFDNNPVWSGDTGQWQANDNNNGGHDGSNTMIIRVNPGNGNAGTFHLRSQITNWRTNQEWGWWMGRTRVTNATSTVRFWLYANESNLESNTVDGYCVDIGDGTGAQEFRLQRILNGAVAATVITSSVGVPATISDYGVGVRVVRNELGNWAMYLTDMPTGSPGGFNLQNGNAVSSATTLRGTGSDNTFTPTGNGWIGPVVTQPSFGNTNANRTTEFDQIHFTPCNDRTLVNFTTTSFTAVEGTTTTITIPVSITNPHPTVATTATIAITTGNGFLINGFTSANVTFTANSSANQNITITITNDATCNGLSNVVGLSITAASGGYLAQIGATNACSISISDNESVQRTIASDDFEDGEASDWFMSDANAFNVSSFQPNSGSFSFRHVNSGQASAATSISIPLNGLDMAGSFTTWRFNLNHFNLEPNLTDYFIVCLTNDQQDIENETIDGYAVGVRPNMMDNTDMITLWRTSNDMLTPIITSTIDWGTTHAEMGFEITRDANGLWTLRVDNNGDFDNLVVQGTATDVTTTYLGYFGIFYAFNTTSRGMLSLDDFTLQQQSCAMTYYSQSTGLSGGALWAPQPVGTPVDITPSAFTNLVVQSGHTVTLNENAICYDYTINSGGTLNGSSFTLRLLGDFEQNGTFVPETSTLRFNSGANNAHTISGAGTIALNNVELDDPLGLSFASPTQLRGQLRAIRGTANTNNQLTLTSTQSGTGSIGRIHSAADVIGQITLQRFIPSAPQHWVYMANPLLNQTLQNWNDEIVTSGFPGSDFPNYNFNSIYWYDETAPGSRNMGWTGATNITNAINPQRGYIVYMNSPAVTVIANGNFQKGNVTVPLSFVDNEPGSGYFNPDGWNLISNVYPSAIDWVALKDNSPTWSGTNSSYYVYDAAASNYRTFNANSMVGTANRYIASSQAFFVQASAANQSIVFSETVKSMSSAAFQRNTEESSFVRFNFTRGTMDDEMILNIREGSTMNFDELYDAIKWDSPVNNAPEIAILASDSAKLSIQTIPNFDESLIIPIYTEMPVAGTYTFSVSQIQNLPTGVCLTATDTQTGTTIALSQGESMSLTTTAPYTGYRIVLNIGAPLIVNAIPASCIGNDDAHITFTSAEEGWMVMAEDVNGTIHYADGGTISNLQPGDYIITMENAEALCPGATLGVTIPDTLPVMSEVAAVKDHCNSGNSGQIELMVANTNHFNYEITNSEGQLIYSGAVEEIYHLITNVPFGVYQARVFSECHDETYTIDLHDASAVQLELEMITPALMLVPGETVTIQASAISESAISYEWTVNGFDGGEESFLDFVVNTPGTYNVLCTAFTEECSVTQATAAIVETSVNVNETLTDPLAKITRMGNAVIIAFENIQPGKAKMVIYNSNGGLVMQIGGNVGDGQVRTLDINGLAAGVYTVDVLLDGQRLSKLQFVK